MTRILSSIIDKSLGYTLQLQIRIGIKNIACYGIKKTKRGSYEVALKRAMYCHLNANIFIYFVTTVEDKGGKYLFSKCCHFK